MRRITPMVCRRWTAATSFIRLGGLARFSTTPRVLVQPSRPIEQGGQTVTAAAGRGAAGTKRFTCEAPLSSEAPSTPGGPIDEKEDISVVGANGEEVHINALASFADLTDLPGWLEDGVRSLDFTTPSVIQRFTIPALQQGHDVIGLAPTGSGKTVAFAIPALQQLKPTQSGAPSVLVLAPTRELVQQTTKVFEKLGRGHVRVGEAYGGAPREIQARRLWRGCDVLVACPGRLKDFLDSGDVSLSNLSFLVFDEADRLLDMGFQVQLDSILAFVEPTQQVQRMMWSATWPDAVQDLARAYLSQDRLLIRAGTAGTGAQVNEHIKQRIVFAEGFQERIEKLVGLIESGEINENTAKVIIFVERQADTDMVADALSRRLGIDSRYVGVLHGGLSQRRRDSVMNDFKSNRTRLLVATDVASRGLDIPDVTCVINFQAPQNIDSYCHRIGRTGRAGRNGDAFTFLGRKDGGISTELIDYLRRCKMDVPSGLTELESHHIEDSRSRRRYNRGGSSFNRGGSSFNRGGSGFSRHGNRNSSFSRDRSPERFGAPRRSSNPDFAEGSSMPQNYSQHQRDKSRSYSPNRSHNPRFKDEDDNGWM